MSDVDFPVPLRRPRPHRRRPTRDDHLRDLIEQVLFTAPGERVMRPDFGSGLLALVFEPGGPSSPRRRSSSCRARCSRSSAHLIAVESVEVAQDEGALQRRRPLRRARRRSARMRRPSREEARREVFTAATSAACERSRQAAPPTGSSTSRSRSRGAARRAAPAHAVRAPAARRLHAHAGQRASSTAASGSARSASCGARRPTRCRRSRARARRRRRRSARTLRRPHRRQRRLLDVHARGSSPAPAATSRPPASTRCSSSVEFSFKVECPSDFDCAPRVRRARRAARRGPTSTTSRRTTTRFRRLMLDRLSLLAPDWTERTAADVGIALVELLAYVADELSYRQDAVATEAYLATARRRMSLRRHARLVDYSSTRAATRAPGCASSSTARASRSTRHAAAHPRAGPADVIEPGSDELRDALAGGRAVVRDGARRRALRRRTSASLLDLGRRGCCLPRGATAATLAATTPTLAGRRRARARGGRQPDDRRAEDADPAQRAAVRLTERRRSSSDPSGRLFDDAADDGPVDVTEIAWDAADALPFPLCISVEEQARPRRRRGVGQHRARRPRPHDRRRADLATCRRPSLRVSPARRPATLLRAVSRRRAVPLRFRPTLDERAADARLRSRGAAWRCRSRDDEQWWPATLAARRSTRAGATPLRHADRRRSARLVDAVDAAARPARRATATRREFVVEVETTARAPLRFGDDVHGQRPEHGTAFVGDLPRRQRRRGQRRRRRDRARRDAANGAIVARDATRMPAAGGIDPEAVDAVRRDAPEAFLVQERAVTAGRLRRGRRARPDVQRAAATFRWTGSWHTVFVTADRVGGARGRRAVSRPSCAATSSGSAWPATTSRSTRRGSCRSRSSCTSASSPTTSARRAARRARRALEHACARREARPLPPRQLHLRPAGLPAAIVAAAQAVEGVESVRRRSFPAPADDASERARHRRAADGPARDRAARQRPELPRARRLALTREAASERARPIDGRRAAGSDCGCCAASTRTRRARSRTAPGCRRSPTASATTRTSAQSASRGLIARRGRRSPRSARATPTTSRSRCSTRGRAPPTCSPSTTSASRRSRTCAPPASASRCRSSAAHRLPPAPGRRGRDVPRVRARAAAGAAGRRSRPSPARSSPACRPRSRSSRAQGAEHPRARRAAADLRDRRGDRGAARVERDAAMAQRDARARARRHACVSRRRRAPTSSRATRCCSSAAIPREQEQRNNWDFRILDCGRARFRRNDRTLRDAGSAALGVDRAAQGPRRSRRRRTRSASARPVFGHNAPLWRHAGRSRPCVCRRVTTPDGMAGLYARRRSRQRPATAGMSISTACQYRRARRQLRRARARWIQQRRREPAPCGHLRRALARSPASAELSRAEFALSGKVTRLGSPANNYDKFQPASESFVRETSAFVASRAAALAEHRTPRRQRRASSGRRRRRRAASPGRRLIVRGARVRTSGALSIASHARRRACDRRHAVRARDRAAARRRASNATPSSCYGNVALATHGETVAQLLGSGNASHAVPALHAQAAAADLSRRRQRDRRRRRARGAGQRRRLDASARRCSAPRRPTARTRSTPTSRAARTCSSATASAARACRPASTTCAPRTARASARPATSRAEKLTQLDDAGRSA